MYKRIISCLFLFAVISAFVFPAGKKKNYISPYLKPLSINFTMNTSPEIYIYTPSSNYKGEFSAEFEFGLSAEYRFFKWLALEQGTYVNPGYHYRTTRYHNTFDNSDHNIQLNNINLFFQQTFSVKFYFPGKAVNDYMNFMLRLGVTFELWTMSYYYLYDNNALSNEGHLFDNTADGPNVYGSYENYKNIHNRFNIGTHIGFGPQFIVGEHVAFIPEFRYTFFLIPVVNGRAKGMDITGLNDIIIRNDGTGDKNLKDYKMLLQIGGTFKFTFGRDGSNLYGLRKKK